MTGIITASRSVGRFLLPFAVGYLALAATFLLTFANYALAIIATAYCLPVAFGWIAERYWHFGATRTTLTAVAIPALGGAAFQIWSKFHQPMLLPILVSWGFLSLAGWYLAVRTEKRAHVSGGQ